MITGSAGMVPGQIATSGAACLTKGMLGTDATGTPYYCSSGLIWTAMGGSDGMTIARAMLGDSNYPTYVVCGQFIQRLGQNPGSAVRYEIISRRSGSCRH